MEIFNNLISSKFIQNSPEFITTRNNLISNNDLLTLILMFVPQSQLMKWKRVCKQWWRIISLKIGKLNNIGEKIYRYNLLECYQKNLYLFIENFIDNIQWNIYFCDIVLFLKKKHKDNFFRHTEKIEYPIKRHGLFIEINEKQIIQYKPIGISSLKMIFVDDDFYLLKHSVSRLENSLPYNTLRTLKHCNEYDYHTGKRSKSLQSIAICEKLFCERDSKHNLDANKITELCDKIRLRSQCEMSQTVSHGVYGKYITFKNTSVRDIDTIDDKLFLSFIFKECLSKKIAVDPILKTASFLELFNILDFARDNKIEFSQNFLQYIAKSSNQSVKNYFALN